MKKWKVALIGCGSIADNTYLPRIKDIPEADMVAVCDIIPERAKDYAEKFNVPAWYTSIDELLEKCDFEILMNTTSIPAHHEINMKALNAGKHLYSQKAGRLDSGRGNRADRGCESGRREVYRFSNPYAAG